MNAEQLVDYLGDIDEFFIREAVPGKRRTLKKWRALAATAAAVLALIAACVPLFVRNLPTEGPDVIDNPAVPTGTAPEPAFTSSGYAGGGPGDDPNEACGDAPDHIYYQGNTYVCRGRYVNTLPESAQLLGQPHYTSEYNPPDSGDDLAGNVENGYFYMDPENDTVLFYRWEEWPASLGQEEKIFLFYREFEGDEAPPAQESVEEPYYDSLRAMLHASDIAAEATVTGVEQDVSIDGSLFDVYTVQITNPFKGETQDGEEIQVKLFPGCELLATSEADHYLLFLYGEPGQPFSPLSPTQGIFPVTGNRLVIVPNDYAPLFPGLPIIEPPYTHQYFPIGAVRGQIESIQTPGQYSVAYLTQVMDYLTPKMGEYGILMLDANELTHQLDILVRDFSVENRQAIADLVYETFLDDSFIYFIDGTGMTIVSTDDF